MSSRFGPSSPCRLRSRSIMMCRCNALAMALESLGRSRSAGMVLPGTLGPWVPGSVADCQTSDPACREAGAQWGSLLVRLGGSPPASRSRVRHPPPAWPGSPPRASAQAGRGFPASVLPPTSPASTGHRPALPSFSSLSRRPPLRALATASHPAELNPSGVRAIGTSWFGRGVKGGRMRDGCLWYPKSSTMPALRRPPSGAARRSWPCASH